MQIKQILIAVSKWLIALVLLVGIVLCVRLFCIQSYRISTDAMEEALRKGDYILVNKFFREKDPGRNQVILFTSPLRRDSVIQPLFISRCIGMPGDTILVNSGGYTINGQRLPRPPQALSTYFISLVAKDTFMGTLRKLNIPQRNIKEEPFGFTLSLTTFEEYQLRNELSEEVSRHFVNEQIKPYSLTVPRKDRPYRLDSAALMICKEIIQSEAGDKASFRNGKLYMDGQETSFFFFRQNYYWMLSDNANEGIDSRHLGFIPEDHIVGKAWFCWYSPDKQHIFKPVY